MSALRTFLILLLLFPWRLFSQTQVYGLKNIEKQISGRVFGVGQVYECDPFNYSEYGYLMKFGKDGSLTTLVFYVSPMIQSDEYRDTGTYVITDTGLIISMRTRHMRRDTLKCFDPECMTFRYVQVKDTGYKREFTTRASLSWCTPQRVRLHCDSFLYATEPNYNIRIPDVRTFEDSISGHRIVIDNDADTLGYYENDTTYVPCQLLNVSVIGPERKWVFRRKNSNVANYLMFSDAEDSAILSGPERRRIFTRTDNEYTILD